MNLSFSYPAQLMTVLHHQIGRMKQKQDTQHLGSQEFNYHNLLLVGSFVIVFDFNALKVRRFSVCVKECMQNVPFL